MNIPCVIKKEECDILEYDWGRIVWYANKSLGNSDELTVGKCFIKPNMENPNHSHPNCAEIFYVERGKISHTFSGGGVELNEGDAISIPANFVHNAKNIGKEEGVLLISFSSADRKTQGE